jgi:hypothetical protein
MTHLRLPPSRPHTRVVAYKKQSRCALQQSKRQPYRRNSVPARGERHDLLTVRAAARGEEGSEGEEGKEYDGELEDLKLDEGDAEEGSSELAASMSQQLRHTEEEVSRLLIAEEMSINELEEWSASNPECVKRCTLGQSRSRRVSPPCLAARCEAGHQLPGRQAPPHPEPPAAHPAGWTSSSQ